MLEIIEVHFELNLRFGFFGMSVDMVKLEIPDFLHKVATVLDVVNLRYEFFLESLGGMKALILLANYHLEVVIGLLDLCDVDSLQLRHLLVKICTYICHLREPLKDDFLLVLIEHI